MQKLFERIQPKPPVKLFERIQPNNIVVQQFQNTNIVRQNYWDGVIVLDEVPVYDIEDYNVYDEKSFKKYIDDIKRIIRSSFEYRRFVNYLRDYMDMNKCSFFQNVNNIETFKIKIELHHSPFTLHDIVLTVFNKRMHYNESLEVEMVAKEVMYIHYFCMVGIIPLAETVHELVHKQIVFIPVDTVFGNYNEFIDIYGEFIPDEVRERYDTIVAQTATYNEPENLKILQQSPLIIQLPGDNGFGTYELPKLESVVSLMKKKIVEMKPRQQIEQYQEIA